MPTVSVFYGIVIEGPVFRPLGDREESARVHIDDLSGAVICPSGADLDSDVIYGIAAQRKSRPRT